MAEALCVVDSQLNLDGISEELSNIDSQSIENKTSEEKKVEDFKSVNNGVCEMTLQRSIGLKFTTVLENLKLYFGHSSFKNIAQKNTIISVLRRKFDVIISMPTGHGRSLCYQLPAILQSPKVTIVVCPIIKRIKEHVKNLIRLNIHAEYLTAETSEDEQKRIVDELCLQNVVNYILYVTPDRAFTNDFHEIMTSLVKKNKLAYMVLDEAHCESQWVYGPKNEYRILGYLRQMYLEIPWIVVTAEAGLDIIDYIRTTLLLKSAGSGLLMKFQSPAFKSNIFYDVIFDELNGNSYSHLKVFIDCTLPKVKNYAKGNQPCGLIFCKTRNAANNLAMALRLKGSLTTTYHAGLTETEQSATYNAFMSGRIQVLAVTGDYGMKLDNKQVMLVVHWGLPSSLAKYYEESRQAGKDGNPARCRIYLTESSTNYFNRANQIVLASALTEAITSSKMQNAFKSFLLFIQSRFMIDYCLYNACRHLLFAEYFGDTKPLCDNKCDICLLNIKADIQDFQRKPNIYSMEKFINKTYKKFIKLDKMDKLVGATDPSHILKACNDMLRNNNFNTAEKLFKSYYQKEKPLSALPIQEEDEEDVEEDLV